MPSLMEHVPRAEARAIVMSLTVGVTLMAIKFVGYFITNSAAIFSDAVESIANVLASGVAFYSLILSHYPADAEHPYGHGKVEFLSAWFEGGMVLLAAIFIFVETTEAIINRRFVSEGRLDFGVALTGAAMLINGGVGLYLIRTGRRSGSMTLEADGKHLLSDAYTSMGVLTALGVVKLTGWVWADPIAALVMASYITWMSLGLLRRAGAGLMDRRDIEDERLLTRILDSHMGAEGEVPRICGYHKLRHRHVGRLHWVEFDLLVPPTLSVSQGHEIASAIEDEIERELGPAKATAHVEPCDHETCLPSRVKRVANRSDGGTE